MMGKPALKRIEVFGDPYERGCQYGAQAEGRIRRCIEVYQGIFETYAGWDWEQVTEHASTYVPAIQRYREHLLDEMRGIAGGAGLALDDVLALNVRTEVMFAAVVRSAAKECTALAALPGATASGHTLLAQNWDWKPDAGETLVILEAKPDRGPAFVTVVEAGLLAKTGLNSAGIGLVTNALVSDDDRGEPGVPYHVILRAILESERASQALDAITRRRRSSSANYLIGHRDGEALNVEVAPGDYSRVFVTFPDDGVLGHTNHFVSPRFGLKDVGAWDGPDSLIRLRRAERLLEARRGELDVDALGEVLSDHFSCPDSVCAHPDDSVKPVEQYATLFSIIMDLESASIWVAAGNPCSCAYEQLDVAFLRDVNRS
ncbi:MAG: C45 family autoproteolytic acyltransferase/hydrolase [Anaerolineae bacterium]|jgi:isopenicillin-N N-acyltransferase-like protein